MKETIGALCLGVSLGLLVYFVFLLITTSGHELQKTILAVLVLGLFIVWSIVGLGKKVDWKF